VQPDEVISSLRPGLPSTGNLCDCWLLPIRISLDLSTKSHLIAIGKLVKPKSYLTPDNRDVFTDSELNVSQIVTDRASVGVAPRVGQLPVMTVTLHGGDLVLNGVSVSLKE
jgi:hypothetical protein